MYAAAAILEHMLRSGIVTTQEARLIVEKARIGCHASDMRSGIGQSEAILDHVFGAIIASAPNLVAAGLASASPTLKGSGAPRPGSSRRPRVAPSQR